MLASFNHNFVLPQKDNLATVCFGTYYWNSDTNKVSLVIVIPNLFVFKSGFRECKGFIARRYFDINKLISATNAKNLKFHSNKYFTYGIALMPKDKYFVIKIDNPNGLLVSNITQSEIQFLNLLESIKSEEDFNSFIGNNNDEKDTVLEQLMVNVIDANIVPLTRGNTVELLTDLSYRQDTFATEDIKV